MEIIIPLLFMAIFYLGPALLKRYRAQQNAQSAIPAPLNSEIRNASPKIKEVADLKSTTELHSTMVVDNLQSVPSVVEEQSAWRGKLDQNSIANGVIFAEILQAPRAYRPFVRR